MDKQILITWMRMEYHIILLQNILMELELGIYRIIKINLKERETGQAWFPKNWTDTDIKNAGEYVVNLPANRNVSDGTWMFGEYNDVRVGVIKNNGEIGTIIPDNSRQP